MIRKGSRFASTLGSALAIVISCAVIAPAIPLREAHAQGKPGGPSKADLDRARKSFGEGLDLEKVEKWADAQEKFEDVAKVRMTPEVRFHIALCEEHRGLLLEAVHDFETAESDARAENKPAVMKEAPEHAAAIKPRIPKIKVKVPTDIEGVNLTLDDNPIDPANTDELPIDPGDHRVDANAEKHQPFTLSFTLAEGETKTITVKLPLIEVEKGEPPPPPPPEEKPKTELVRKTPTLGYVIGGVGVVSLVLSGVFYAKRNSIKSDLDNSCKDLSCPPEKADDISSGKSATTLTNVFGVVGVAGVGVGLYLILTAPKEEQLVDGGDGGEKHDKESEAKGARDAVSMRIVPGAPGANIGGLALYGAF